MVKRFCVYVLIKSSLVRSEKPSEWLMYQQVRMGYFALRLPCPDWKVRPLTFSKVKHDEISLLSLFFYSFLGKRRLRNMDGRKKSCIGISEPK